MARRCVRSSEARQCWTSPVDAPRGAVRFAISHRALGPAGAAGVPVPCSMAERAPIGKALGCDPSSDGSNPSLRLAQLGEQSTDNRRVGGSTPPPKALETAPYYGRPAGHSGRGRRRRRLRSLAASPKATHDPASRRRGYRRCRRARASALPGSGHGPVAAARSGCPGCRLNRRTARIAGNAPSADLFQTNCRVFPNARRVASARLAYDASRHNKIIICCTATKRCCVGQFPHPTAPAPRNRSRDKEEDRR